MNSLTFERWYPEVIAVAATLLACQFGFEFPEDGRRELLSSTISVGAILAGFLGTAKAILMALPQTLMTDLRESRYMGDLVRYLTAALLSCLGLCLLSVLAFFASAGGWLDPLWVGVGIYATVAFWRVGRLMLALLQVRP